MMFALPPAQTSEISFSLLRRADDELCKADVRNLNYKQIEKKDDWKVGFIHEIIDLKMNKWEVEGFSEEELADILTYLCTA